MLTLFLRKDMLRAQVLADDLDRYSEQLHYTLDLGKSHYLQSLASPTGLLLCFGAGCLVSLAASRGQSEEPSTLGRLVALAKSSL